MTSQSAAIAVQSALLQVVAANVEAIQAQLSEMNGRVRATESAIAEVKQENKDRGERVGKLEQKAEVQEIRIQAIQLESARQDRFYGLVNTFVSAIFASIAGYLGVRK